MEFSKGNRLIVKEFRQKMTLMEYTMVQQNRRILPTFEQKQNILKAIKENQIIILKGETGCGKSTQVPQFIFDDWIESFDSHGRNLEIVCTQPRRISAIGVARRVADERLEQVGQTVGYQIRFENCASKKTRLIFCTIGVLLRRIQRESLLGAITHVIVDEVHERGAENDFLLLILKKVMKIRQDLKVILMSATLDTKLLSEYFEGIPVIEISGRTYPVEQIFLENFLEKTGYKLGVNSEYFIAPTRSFEQSSSPFEEIEDQNLSLGQLRRRYKDFSEKTCQTISNMNVDKVDCDLIMKALEWIVKQQHRDSTTGSILIFLPGIAEIYKMMNLLNDYTRSSDYEKFRIYPLHSSLSSEEQASIFEKLEEGISKIILSTNLAETSITIDDCIFVIDSGKMRQKRFDPDLNIESLETLWVSQTNVIQRSGRAGRVKPGVCIHLYTKHRFEYNFVPSLVPEIKRTPLDSLVLYMKVLIKYNYENIGEVFSDLIEPPPYDNVIRTIMNLKKDQVIDERENLTPIGYHLAALPLDVKPGKLLIYGTVFDCLDAALTMAAYMSHKTPFAPPFNANKKIITEKKKSLSVAYSDQITVFRVYREYTKRYKQSEKYGLQYLEENYLSFNTMTEIKQIKYQLLQSLVTLGFVILDQPLDLTSEHDEIDKITKQYNKNEMNNKLLSAILCASLYPNIVKTVYGKKRYPGYSICSCEPLKASNNVAYIPSLETVYIDPKSVNFSIQRYPHDYLVYYDKEKRSDKLTFQESTLVSVISLVLFSNCDIDLRPGASQIFIEKKTIVLTTANYLTADLIKKIKTELFALIEDICRHPALGIQHQERGKKVISALVELLH